MADDIFDLVLVAKRGVEFKEYEDRLDAILCA